MKNQRTHRSFEEILKDRKRRRISLHPSLHLINVTISMETLEIKVEKQQKEMPLLEKEVLKGDVPPFSEEGVLKGPCPFLKLQRFESLLLLPMSNPDTFRKAEDSLKILFGQVSKETRDVWWHYFVWLQTMSKVSQNRAILETYLAGALEEKVGALGVKGRACSFRYMLETLRHMMSDIRKLQGALPTLAAKYPLFCDTDTSSQKHLSGGLPVARGMEGWRGQGAPSLFSKYFLAIQPCLARSLLIANDLISKITMDVDEKLDCAHDICFITSSLLGALKNASFKYPAIRDQIPTIVKADELAATTMRALRARRSEEIARSPCFSPLRIDPITTYAMTDTIDDIEYPLDLTAENKLFPFWRGGASSPSDPLAPGGAY
jgi:hypothetical protein